jgi:hypothetical protein
MMCGSANDGVSSFANVDEELDDTDESEPAIVLATDGTGQRKQEYKKRDKSHITCHHCHKKGHYANECAPKNVMENVSIMLPNNKPESSC